MYTVALQSIPYILLENNVFYPEFPCCQLFWRSLDSFVNIQCFADQAELHMHRDSSFFFNKYRIPFSTCMFTYKVFSLQKKTGTIQS